jgi:hypothetical protein
MHVKCLQWLLHCTVAVALENKFQEQVRQRLARLADGDSSSQAHIAAQSAGVHCGTHFF